MHNIKILTTALAAIILGVLPVWAMAAGDNNGEDLVLRAIMRDMASDMRKITDGIVLEEWQAIAEAAARIADHRKPPLAERQQIMGFLGNEAGKFKSYDNEVHLAAGELSEAAMREDGTAVIDSFAKVQSGCLACHGQFRNTILEHFYGNQ
jgi:cytochrome c556